MAYPRSDPMHRLRRKTRRLPWYLSAKDSAVALGSPAITTSAAVKLAVPFKWQPFSRCVAQCRRFVRPLPRTAGDRSRAAVQAPHRSGRCPKMCEPGSKTRAWERTKSSDRMLERQDCQAPFRRCAHRLVQFKSRWTGRHRFAPWRSRFRLGVSDAAARSSGPDRPQLRDNPRHRPRLRLGIRRLRGTRAGGDDSRRESRLRRLRWPFRFGGRALTIVMAVI
jgi:hypothetical protein